MRSNVRVFVVLLLSAAIMPMLSVTEVRAATVTATNFTDRANGACATTGAGDCTLREAVIYSNTHAATMIALMAGVYALTIAPVGTDDATSGDLNLVANVAISGQAAGISVIDAGGMSPRDGVFKVDAGVNAALARLTIRNGHATNGGGIDNLGIVALTGVSITGNVASAFGGAIYNQGTLTVDASIIGGAPPDGNTAMRGGGILSYTFDTASALVVRNNTVILGNQAVFGNAYPDGCGGGIYSWNSQTIIDGSIVGGTAPDAANVSDGCGGGIYHVDGTLMIQNGSQVLGNVAGRPGSAYHTTSGGGIDSGGTLIVSGSAINRNTASQGAGISWGGPGTITKATIQGNVAADSGGGIWFGGSGPDTIADSTISENTAVNGGGIYINNNGWTEPHDAPHIPAVTAVKRRTALLHPTSGANSVGCATGSRRA
ncbi:MAG: hypothetical protein ACR2JW_02455, partial [Thermomicrobiales bacterium]